MIKGSGSKRPKNIPTDPTDLDPDPRHCWRQFSGTADSYWYWISRIRILLFSLVTFKLLTNKYLFA